MQRKLDTPSTGMDDDEVPIPDGVNQSEVVGRVSPSVLQTTRWREQPLYNTRK
ncbi:MAG: hypothetical protein KatS3mg113_0178 [Planctomycetaceae bacterium]|nr:MAG: hypothetical protein KatS3mg113_0178 [Planctomycetaceae bacterium]